MKTDWTKVKYIDKLMDKKCVKNYKKVKKQLLKIFPQFQQFKIEIRNQEEWIMDWTHLLSNKN